MSEPAINGFRGAYRWLSNFYVEPDGTHVEGEYQASKAADIKQRQRLCKRFLLMTPAQAKKVGRTIHLRPDWEQAKLGVMHRLVKKKFQDHSNLRRLLFGTKQKKLVEENWWGDQFWGVCRGSGRNHLGRILMRVRRELLEQRSKAKRKPD